MIYLENNGVYYKNANGTNLVTKGKAQRIVGQSLLSRLHHLGTFKSSANDLSLPIYEIAIAP